MTEIKSRSINQSTLSSLTNISIVSRYAASHTGVTVEFPASWNPQNETDYDPTVRPWFQNTIDTVEDTAVDWMVVTGPYVDFGKSSMIFTFSVPIFIPNATNTPPRVVSIVSADVTGQTVIDWEQYECASRGHRCLILDRTAHIILRPCRLTSPDPSCDDHFLQSDAATLLRDFIGDAQFKFSDVAQVMSELGLIYNRTRITAPLITWRLNSSRVLNGQTVNFTWDGACSSGNATLEFKTRTNIYFLHFLKFVLKPNTTCTDFGTYPSPTANCPGSLIGTTACNVTLLDFAVVENLRGAETCTGEPTKIVLSSSITPADTTLTLGQTCSRPGTAPLISNQSLTLPPIKIDLYWLDYQILETSTRTTRMIDLLISSTANPSVVVQGITSLNVTGSGRFDHVKLLQPNAGVYELFFWSIDDLSLNTSLSFVICPGNPVSLTITKQPSSTANRFYPLGQQPAVTFFDALGNVASTVSNLKVVATLAPVCEGFCFDV